MKNILFSIFTALTFSVTFINAQTSALTPSAENQTEEVLKIDTRLVRMAFIAPFSKTARYEVFDNDQRVEDFQIVTPASEQKVDWILYLDIDPKAMPEYGFNHLKKELKRAAKATSAPTIITNIQGMSIKKARDKADIPDDWTVLGANGTTEAWEISERLLANSTNSRKALFWLSTEEPEMTPEVLGRMPRALTDKGTFTYITTIKPGKAKKFKEGGDGIIKGKRQQQIGRSNLSLNTVFAAGMGSDLIEHHFGVFVEQCRQLNLIYFAGETESGESKIYGNLEGGVRVRVQSKTYRK